jgi:hypothetical protein
VVVGVPTCAREAVTTGPGGATAGPSAAAG